MFNYFRPNMCEHFQATDLFLLQVWDVSTSVVGFCAAVRAMSFLKRHFFFGILRWVTSHGVPPFLLMLSVWVQIACCCIDDPRRILEKILRRFGILSSFVLHKSAKVPIRTWSSPVTASMISHAFRLLGNLVCDRTMISRVQHGRAQVQSDLHSMTPPTGTPMLLPHVAKHVFKCSCLIRCGPCCGVMNVGVGGGRMDTQIARLRREKGFRTAFSDLACELRFDDHVFRAWPIPFDSKFLLLP